jgi:hypothetical protein
MICRMPNLRELPDEVLGLVLHKLDFGDFNNKGDLAALLTSCKDVKQAIVRCPITVKLQAYWQAHQLAGNISVPG